MNGQFKKEHFLYSNSGDLYRIPVDILKKYILSDEEFMQRKEQMMEIVFDTEEIYEIPGHLLYDYIVTEEEKLKITSNFMNLKIKDIEEPERDNTCLFIFDYIASCAGEKAEVSGYSNTVSTAARVNSRINKIRADSSSKDEDGSVSINNRTNSIKTARESQDNMSWIKREIEKRSSLSADEKEFIEGTIGGFVKKISLYDR